MAAVRRPVTVGPSSTKRISPVVASYALTWPRIVGSPRAALPGHTFTSLWLARSRALDGIDSITPPA
ncbi:hypothetical protein BamMEX5DRAFT_6901 [Burkholderia ambifaria MEX-5]|uniref:Uncharacterized protein n=1 Tax=Burkholderia ambifaria MEX-5 TaxID=396597 RepID=B1TGI5_9BURK|nr:hypothetical protein BamMEX5DRAFT_6901 [Burkholderia ambifaria MEX-5]